MIESIITIRNREASRIEAVIRSLRDHGADTSFLVVDYGSEPEYAAAYRSLAERGLFRLLRMETQGWPWNKCHAINAGVRASSAPWIATIDVDMVFDCNPFPYCLENHPEKKLQVMQASFLPPSGERKKAWFGSVGHPGGFVFQSRTAFEVAGGYDERIQYWGHEDWDWPHRLERLGYRMEWLPETFRFYHVWHPTANDPTRRPQPASFDTARVYFLNQVSPMPAAPWGRMVTPADRPVLPYVGDPSVPVLTLEPGAWINSFPQILSFLALHPVARIDWGRRTVRRKLETWTGFRPLFQALVSPFGWTVNDQVNQNFDFWYATRESLEAVGVIDWSLAPDLGSIVLYRKGTP